jgi:hypothetical protein
MATATRTGNGFLIFRRFRRLRNGRVLDAWAYGLKGWPIRIRSK